jgi:hypothetical protein
MLLGCADCSILSLNFTITVEEKIGVLIDKPLKRNGTEIDVTNKNREEYVRLMVKEKLEYKTRKQMEVCFGWRNVLLHVTSVIIVVILLLFIYYYFGGMCYCMSRVLLLLLLLLFYCYLFIIILEECVVVVLDVLNINILYCYYYYFFIIYLLLLLYTFLFYFFFQAIRHGFSEIVPLEMIKNFTPNKLVLLFFGVSKVKKNTYYHGFE